jgi:hypothetical protein
MGWLGRKRGSQTGSTERPGQTSLIEYLFVDETRLDSYFQQISGPTALDTVPTFGGTLSLTGPSVSGGIQKNPRPFTRHEKIEALLTYLRAEDQLASQRVDSIGPGAKVFRLESCRATQAVLALPNSERSLTIWVCGAPRTKSHQHRHQPGRLYLIEDFRGSDYPGGEHEARSSYTALMMMLEDPDIGARVSDAGFDPRAHTEAFAAHPVELIKQLGGEIGLERPIRVLYRVRATLAEGLEDFTVATIGYPIVIADDPR